MDTLATAIQLRDELHALPGRLEQMSRGDLEAKLKDLAQVADNLCEALRQISLKNGDEWQQK